ncbi:MAG: hypothetical protein GYA15_09740 [Leptolinea sp.]|jgi:hypothetical protein|nr:hypothetical protein [Leptolinea sp.]
MKKFVYTLLILIVLMLTACAGQAPVVHLTTGQSADQLISYKGASFASASSSANKSGITTDFENAESVINQMILGLLKLDGSKLALTKDQATSILPLWDEYQKAVQSAMPSGKKPSRENPSGTPAAPPTPVPGSTPAAAAQNTELTTKLDTLTSQMVAVLTTDQVNAIAEMKITHDIATTIMKEIGIEQQNGGQPGGTSSDNGQPQPPASGQGNGRAAPPDGQPGQQGGQPGQQDGQPGQQGGQPGQQGGQPDGQQGQPPADGVRQGQGMIQPGLMKAFTALLEKASGTKSTVAFAPAGLNPAGQFHAGKITGGPGQGGQENSNSQVVYTAAYKQQGGSEIKTGQTITASENDQSGILVTDSGTLSLSNSKITTSGNTSSQDSSSFAGVNAAVLAINNSTIHLEDSTITTTGEGANGAFAVGKGSTVDLSNVVIDATANGAHGVMATRGGVLTLKDVDITTRGESSAALATDRGGGTITAVGGNIATTGNNSPAIYSTGNIIVKNMRMSATGSESAVIEGANTITLNDSVLTSSMENKWGVMIYQSMSGDAEGIQGTFSMSGGELTNTASSGPLFFVTNSIGVINLSGVTVVANSGELIDASANRWGNEGTNGGTVIFTADNETLSGSITADKISSINISLMNNSSLKSAINPTHSAKEINLTLDGTSHWTVTANSYISKLINPAGISGTSITNITGNGFTVYYNPTNCPDLGGKTYSLDGGGVLTPVS